MNDTINKEKYEKSIKYCLGLLLNSYKNNFNDLQVFRIVIWVVCFSISLSLFGMNIELTNKNFISYMIPTFIYLLSFWIHDAITYTKQLRLVNNYEQFCNDNKEYKKYSWLKNMLNWRVFTIPVLSIISSFIFYFE